MADKTLQRCSATVSFPLGLPDMCECAKQTAERERERESVCVFEVQSHLKLIHTLESCEELFRHLFNWSQIAALF